MRHVIIFLTLFFCSLTGWAQTTEWYYDFDLGTSTEEGKGIVLGQDGNLYVAGTTDDETNVDIIVVSLTTEGKERWTYRYNGPITNSVDKANNIFYGNDNRIYVAGQYSVSANTYKFLVLCIDTSGNLVWEYQKPGTSGTGEALDVVEDNNHNALACGRVGTQFFVTSLNNQGQENWTYEIDDGTAYQLVFGNDGNTYVAGSIQNPQTSSFDLTVLQLNSSGKEGWTYFYNSADTGGDWANDIIYGSDGNLYVAGIEGYQGHNEQDIVVLSVDRSGKQRWVYLYDGPGEKPYFGETCYQIIQGKEGNLYVTGRDGGINTDLDVVVLSLDEEGAVNWIYRYAGVYGDYDMDFAITQTPDRNVHAAGYFCGLIAEVGMNSIHGTTGRGLWNYRYVGASISMDAAYDITSDIEGYVYLTGYDNVNDNNNKLFVIKLNPPRNSDGGTIIKGSFRSVTTNIILVV